MEKKRQCMEDIVRERKFLQSQMNVRKLQFQDSEKNIKRLLLNLENISYEDDGNVEDKSSFSSIE